MKFTSLLLMAGAIVSTEAIVSDNQQKLYNLMQLQKDDCPPPLEISEDSLHFQLGEFSRNFKMENWDNAMKIKEGLDK